MASTSERRRQLARQRWERQQARRAEEAARVRRRRKVLAVFTAVVVVAGGIVAALQWAPWADDDTTTVTDDPPASTDCTYTESATPNAEIGLPPDPATAAGTARLTVNGQPVDVQLLPDVAPCTVSSLVHLAGKGYFDGTTCHRLTTSATLKVLQCGDPTGSGGGGPGYEFGLENTDGAYAAGTVAMAHRSGEPESNGSQFFLVYGDSQLPPEYTVFGQITAGLEVLTGIADAGTADGAEDGAPKEPVTLDTVVTGA